MELELGLKITRARDGSSSIFQFSKQHVGGCFVFVSRETETMFILIGNLPGFTWSQVWIEINELGTEIKINGKGCCVEESLTVVNWIPTWMRGPKIQQFKKIFRIPDGVILDDIEAKFDEEDGVLTIVMPKWKKGVIQGIEIEEVTDEEHQIGPEDMREKPESGKVEEENGAPQQKDTSLAHGRRQEEDHECLESTDLSKQEEDIQAPKEDTIGDEREDSGREIELAADPPENDSESPVHQTEESGDEGNVTGLSEMAAGGGRRGRSCGPCLWAGSAVLMTLIVLVIQLLRGKKKRY